MPAPPPLSEPAIVSATFNLRVAMRVAYRRVETQRTLFTAHSGRYVAAVRLVAVWILLMFALAARAADGRPLVVTSFLPIYSWTVNVAGKHARVENLLSANAEPHEYAFTTRDVRKLNSADLVIINGLGLENWITKWQAAAKPQPAKVITLSDALTPHLIDGNPHFWLDPQLASAAVSNIAAALQRIDPANSSAYASNATAYVTRLHKLDAEFREAVAALTNRALVTYHDAFPYLARRYEFKIAGVVETIPEVEPTPRHLEQLRKTMQDHGIRTIFIPPHSHSRLARQLAKDWKMRIAVLDTLESGALKADAYEAGMRANLKSLTNALK